MIWVLATLVAAALQTARNAAQAGLTASIGTLGATAVRFLFGLPFAVAGLALAALIVPLPSPGPTVMAYVAMGSAAQIAATAFMLLTMQGQSFGVATALMKTEPVTLAVFGVIFLAEPLGPARIGAIMLAVAGVLLTSNAGWSRAGLRPVLTGVTAGGLFGLSSIGFRGALLAMPSGGFFLRALVCLTLTLAVQSAVLLIWLAIMNRAALRGIVRQWRVSLTAGALGAFASLFWFMGFALTPAANVRTLALIEVVFAQVVSGRVLRQGVAVRQIAGIAMIMLGVGWLLAIAAR